MKESVKSTLDKMDGLYRKLNVEVDAAEVKSAFDRVYKGIQANATIKGFRKGKAPIATIKSLYAEKVKDDVLNDLVSAGYQLALDEHDLTPIGYPKLNFDNITPDASFKFSAEFEIRPTVALKKIEGLAIEKEKLVISDKQIEDVLENIRTSQAELVPVFEDRAAISGDTADINFDGYVDGVPLPGGKADNHMLELGAGQFIEGFEEGVIGMKIGETKELMLQFPQEYHNKEIAGRPVKFLVKLNGLKKKSLPELNDELAKKVGDFENVEALKAAIKEDITKNEERRINDDLRNKILRKLVEENPVDTPETLKAQQKQMIMQDVQQRLAQQGLGDKDFEDYKEKWADDFEDSAKFMVQSTFLVDAIAEQLKLRATAKDVEEKIVAYSKETQIPLERLKEFYKDADKKSRLGFQITEERVVNYLIEKAQIKEVEPKKES